MRTPSKTFEDLVVWQKAHQLGLGTVLVEVSKLLEAYSHAILNSDS
jgi:hypothetical protein